MAGKQSLLSIIMGLDSKRFESGLSRAQKRMRKFSAGLKRTGRAMTMGVTAPLAAIAASSFKVAADFELAMKKVKAISGATGNDFKLLETDAKKLGASTVFSASQVAELQLEMAKLGLSAQEIKNATKDTLSLAQAFGTELGPTAETVVKTLNQFGLSADDSGKVADVMATAFANSALDLEKFSGSMANAGPVAKNFGFSMEETTALLGVLANNGIEGADAGTKLKMAFSKLAAEGVDVKETFGAIINGSLDYKDAIDVLGKRAAILSPIFGENLEDLAKLNQKFAESEGAANSMAAEMDNSASGGVAAMRSAIEGAQITLGTALAPTIMRVVRFVADLAQKFSALSTETQNMILVAGGLAMALGPALTVIGALASPLGLAAAAMGALAIGIAKVVIKANSFQEKSQTLQGTINALNKEIAGESAEARVLFARLKDVNLAEDDRAKAIETLQNKYPELLKNLDKNATNLDAIEAAERRVITAIEDRVRAQVLADAQTARLDAETALQLRITNAEFDIAEARPDIDQSQVREITKFIRKEIEKFIKGDITSFELGDSLGSLSSGSGSEIVQLVADELDLGDFNLPIGGVFSGIVAETNELASSTIALRNIEKVLDDIAKSEKVRVVDSDSPDQVEDLLAKLMEYGTTAEVVKKGNEVIEDSSESAGDGLDELLGPARTFADVSGDLAAAFEHIGEKSEVLNNFDEKAAKIAAITAAITELIDSDIETPTGELEKLAEQLANLGGSEDDTELTPMEKLKEQMQEIQTLQGLPFITDLQTATQAVMVLEEAMRASALADPNFINSDQFVVMAEQLDILREKMEGLKETQSQVNDELDHGALLGDAMGQMVGAAFSSAQGDGESFAEATKRIFLNLISRALSTAIANAIAAAFSPASPDNYVTGGAAAPAKAAGLTAIIQGLFSSIPKMHSGGMTLGPTLALIGDNASGREAVIPFERMGDFLGQVAGNNQNMNVTGKINGQNIILSHERALRQRGR